MRTFDQLLDYVTHDLEYKPSNVISAIDELCERRTEWTDTQRSVFLDAAYALKWAGHYPFKIEDPARALKDNPGFYIDLVLWQGYKKTKRMSDGSQEVAGPQQ